MHSRSHSHVERVMGQLQSSRVARAVASNRQLEEVMTDFWLNHFNVYAQKGPPEAYYLAEYERTSFRPNALGKFRDLLESVAKSPAMLFYLDNARSMADSTRPHLASLDRGDADKGPAAQSLVQLAGEAAFVASQETWARPTCRRFSSD